MKTDLIMEEFMNIQKKLWPNDEDMIAYIKKETAKAVKMDDGRMYGIEKPKIETWFCYGESGYDYDEAQKNVDRCYRDEGYFIEQNERNLKNIIDRIKDGEVYIATTNVDELACVTFETWRTGGIRNASESEQKRLLEAYEEVLKRFDTRLHTYLKRYGLKKIHAWSYWRDE